MEDDAEYKKMLANSNMARNPLIKAGATPQMPGKPLMQVSKGGPTDKGNGKAKK